MNTIKFSHAYQKLIEADSNAVRTARLLLVTPISGDVLRQSPDFVTYDTDNSKYEMLGYSEWYLLLIFQKPSGEIFTTVRAHFNHKGNKKPYYDARIGQDFKIEIPVMFTPKKGIDINRGGVQ